MIPWVNPEAKLLIGMKEEEFNRKLAAVGNDEYLGDTSAFQLLYVFAFQGAALSLLTLFDKGVDLFSTTEFGINILHLAAAGGCENIVCLALDRGFDVNLKVKGGRGLTPLMFAARMGHKNIIALLVERGARVDATDNDGNSTLSHAAARGHEAVVCVLLDNGANVQFKNPDGWSALHYASNNGHAKVVETLIGHGADVNAIGSDGLSSLLRAINNNHTKAIRVLLQNCADPNLKSGEHEWTALGTAVWMGKEAIVQLIIDASVVDIDLEAKMGIAGRTALEIAVDKNLERSVRILVQKGADIRERDNSAEARSRNSYIRRLLEEAGNQGTVEPQQPSGGTERRWWERLSGQGSRRR